MADLSKHNEIPEPEATTSLPTAHSKRYEIERLTDILQVPEDKFEAFLEDLRTYYTMGIHMTKLLETVADIGGIKAQVVPQKMTWIDDDLHNATVYLKTATKGNDMADERPGDSHNQANPQESIPQ